MKNTLCSGLLLLAATTASAQYVHVGTKDGSLYLFETKDVKTMTVDGSSVADAGTHQVDIELKNGSKYTFSNDEIETVSVDNIKQGVDMTYKIVNPGFEDGTYGWKAVVGTHPYYTQTNNEFRQKKGFTYAEFWHKNGTYTIQQEIANMPAGVYKLSAYACSLNNSERLFINDAKSGEIASQDENSESFYSVCYVNEQVGNLTIGATGNDTGHSWNTVDAFTLRYLGNTGDVWAMALPEFTGKTATKYMLSKYDKLVEAVKTSEGDDLKSAYRDAKAYAEQVEANIAAWKEYEEVLAKAERYSAQPSLAELASEIAAYLANNRITPDMDSKDTEDVKTESKHIKDLINYFVYNIPAGTDVTFLFENTDFAKGWAGWTREISDGEDGNVEVDVDARCAEAWFSGDFDIYQQIENAPAGFYKIEVQGFYRYDRGYNAWAAYFDETTGEKRLDAPESPVFVYLNDNLTPLANVFDYKVENGTLYSTSRTDLLPYVDPQGEYWYPNDMTAAGQAFDEGYYKVNASGFVANKGDNLRLGVKGNTTQNNDSWAIFTRFKLVYMGTDMPVDSGEIEGPIAVPLPL